jgi:hypothetical protein
LLNAGFLVRLQEALCTTLWWTKQTKCIRDLTRLILGYRSGIIRFFDFEPGFLEPTKIGHARIVKKRLTFSESAPDPSHSHLGIGTEAERNHEIPPAARRAPSSR